MHFSIEMSRNISPFICILFCNVCDNNLRGMSTLQVFLYYRRMTFVIVLVEKEIILFYSFFILFHSFYSFSRTVFFMNDSQSNPRLYVYVYEATETLIKSSIKPHSSLLFTCCTQFYKYERINNIYFYFINCGLNMVNFC